MLDSAAAASPEAPVKKVNPNAPTAETVLSVEHYTDRLFSFKLTRPQAFRFRSGEFVMIGLEGEKKPLLRAYSVASPSWAEELEFYSIKVPDGPLTSRLQKIQPGDKVLLGKKPTGTLVLDALIPGKRLYLLATGTGIAPFASVIRDPETYEQYDQVILVHCCREVAELAYGFKLIEEIKNDELVSEFVGDKLVHFATVTREDYPVTGRITTLMESGKLYDDLCVPDLSRENDRVMICGSMEMFRDLKAICEKAGLSEGSNAKPGEFVVEKAFAG
ncbi:ferredoxin--NADP reductase [Rhodovibrionaceae bacterium A322]